MSGRPSQREDERLSGAELDPDAPPTPEELAAAERLRAAMAQPQAAAPDVREDLDFIAAIGAAWAPAPLDESEHAQMLDDLPTSAEETILARALRDDIEGVAPEAESSARTDSMMAAPAAASERANSREMLVALRAAWNPAEVDDAEHCALIQKALDTHAEAGTVVAIRAHRGRPMRVAVVTTTVLALAASVVVWLRTAASPLEVPLARARTTQPLFVEPFKAGEASARIDRIAAARASDYRDNRFMKWGVR